MTTRSPRFMQPAFVAGCLVLAGCVSTSSPSVPTSGASVQKVAEPVFAADAIIAGSTGKEIDFGRTEPGAIVAMSKLMGSGPSDVAAACSGLRAARWRDGTTLYFEERPHDPAALVGWRNQTGSAGRTCAS